MAFTPEKNMAELMFAESGLYLILPISFNHDFVIKKKDRKNTILLCLEANKTRRLH